MALASGSTAARVWVGERWEYRAVTAMPETVALRLVAAMQLKKRHVFIAFRAFGDDAILASIVWLLLAEVSICCSKNW